ncbi:uncharacterized protein O3C94_020182 [Discoglossus pictus]
MSEDKKNMEKVAERFLHQALEMIYLLTGEVPIKCDDVAVYFSMEEWEYIEEHKELYKDVMMENHQTLRTLGIPTNRSSGRPDEYLETLSIGEDAVAEREEPDIHQEEICPRPLTDEANTDIVQSTEQVQEPSVGSHQEDKEMEIQGNPSMVLSLPTYEIMSGQMKEESQTPSSSEDTKVDDDYSVSESYQNEQEACPQSKNFIYRTRRARKDTSNCAKLHTRIEERKDEKASYVRRKSQVSTHRSDHTDQKPFVCQQCGKDFSLIPGHDKTHTEKKPHVCQECDLVVTAESDVVAQQHVLSVHKITHTGEKPYVCQECGKGFSQKTHLAAHNRTHTGEKPFVCNHCGKGFSHKQVLSVHNMTHTGEKPYACQECGKCFSQKAHLAAHNRTHTGEKPFTCSECDKVFSEKFAMLEHQRVHTGEKPWICQECGKSFPFRSNLVAHKRIHTEEKPFYCQKCGKGFSSRSYFIKHQKTHT